MGSFIYKNRLVYYHEFSEDIKNRKRIIILKSSGEFEYFKHNTASELGYYSSDGPAYNVMWMEYGMQEGNTRILQVRCMYPKRSESVLKTL